VVHRERVTSTHDTTHDTHVADKRHSRMLPSVVAQRSIPTRHPVNTVYRSLHSLRAKKAGDMLSRCQLWYFPRHTPLGSSTMPGLADATDSARATVGVRQEIRVTRLYRARVPSGWIGLD
jgi:hypothetical protein